MPTLLIVEDSDEDFEATMRSLHKIGVSCEVARCIDGDDALDRLNRRGAYAGRPGDSSPNLILLDLNLPATDGREVLREIKCDLHLKTIPVLVFTTSSNPKDIEACYQAGANSYLIKPVNIPELTKKLQGICDYWFGTVVLPNPVG